MNIYYNQTENIHAQYNLNHDTYTDRRTPTHTHTLSTPYDHIGFNDIVYLIITVEIKHVHETNLNVYYMYMMPMYRTHIHLSVCNMYITWLLWPTKNQGTNINRNNRGNMHFSLWVAHKKSNRQKCAVDTEVRCEIAHIVVVLVCGARYRTRQRLPGQIIGFRMCVTQPWDSHSVLLIELTFWRACWNTRRQNNAFHR